MSPARRTRGSDINTLARLRAVLTSPTLLRLGARLNFDQPVGRPPVHPPYVLLAYGTLARLARSGVRVEYDLTESATWKMARELLVTATADLGLDVPPPGRRPPRWDHWRWIRDHYLTTDEGLAQLGREYPAVAADLARSLGLCRTDGPGTLTHPDRTRCVYGDGTLVRPIYAPPETVEITLDDGTRQKRYPDPRTGELHEQPLHRYDPDLQPHHGRLGPVLTHGYVAWHVRGPKPYQRVVLAVDHVSAPGQEAATSVRLAGEVHRHLGHGVQAAIYDGAMHGVHIEHLMRRYGWLVLAKTPAAGAPETGIEKPLFVNHAGKRQRSYPLGFHTHDTPAGSCRHQLAALDGAVVEIDLDDNGDPVVVDRLERGAVKRSRRATGEYHFNIGYRIPCPREPCTTWLSPHPGRRNDTGRPHNIRIIAESDPDFAHLYGLRNDAENFHSNLKRTLIVDRAMSLGWRRGLIDIYCYALLNNALAEHQAARALTSSNTTLTRVRRHYSS
ncbi:hypothetical protein AB0N29_19680 [Nocardioides sp. NPDC092400]|uniref:hypothetical protein n=1 Tax=Nocardioides sp. NPDC092400 TaxID=3155196 RepID=UPI00343FA3E5